MRPDLYAETIVLPRRAIRFPIEMHLPLDFNQERLETWPTVVGRLEFYKDRLLYMPPCGDMQQDTVTDVVILLGAWVRQHRSFVLATNEAGMRLGGATRAADAAIWRRKDLGAYRGGLRRVPPVLAVEVAGADEEEGALREKAHWYIDNGVNTVWLVLPDTQELMVLTPNALAVRLRGNQLIPAVSGLPDLGGDPVSALFFQLDDVGDEP